MKNGFLTFIEDGETNHIPFSQIQWMKEDKNGTLEIYTSFTTFTFARHNSNVESVMRKFNRINKNQRPQNKV